MGIASWSRYLQDATFGALYRQNLLYNTCWEDPAVDHQALKLTKDSEVVVITSAGCNALDYALGDPSHPQGESPRRVVAVDANPWQTAVIELKIAGIRSLEHTDFFALFGYGKHRDAKNIYAQKLRSQLTPASRKIWDAHIHWFIDNRRGETFYSHGLSGLVGRGVRATVHRKPRLWRAVNDLLDCRDQHEQRHIYDERVEPELFSAGLRWILNRQLMMSMLGVPAEQTIAVRDANDDGVAGFVRDSMRHVFRNLPFHENYFWTLYLRGHYTPHNCPRYLSSEGFHKLKAGRIDAVRPVTATLTQALTSDAVESPSHFILLDHMDWMGKAHPQALSEEWEAIFSRGRTSSRILWRSGGLDTDFVDNCLVGPQTNRYRVGDRLQNLHDLAEQLHPQDRVGTYACFRIADVVS